MPLKSHLTPIPRPQRGSERTRVERPDELECKRLLEQVLESWDGS